MGKTALMFWVMLALSAIAISGQGQTDQTAASATTTTTTTTESTVGPTTTTTTTDMTLYEGGPIILPGVKAHIKITKNPDADLTGYIYKITIEDDPEQAGFTPKDIVATFSVDNNVYIKYDDMKIQYSLYDVTTRKRNYMDYKPNPCDENGRDLVNALAGLTPQGIILNFYDIAKSGTELIGCLNDVYDWSADLSVDGNKIVKPEELQKEELDKYKIINKVMGADEKERNNRHVETIVYSKDPKSDQTVPPRSVVITIPVRPKDRTVNSDIKMWIDIRGYRSIGVEGQVDTPSQAQNIAYSLVPCSLGIYFENQNMFQKEPPTSTEKSTKQKKVIFPDPNLDPVSTGQTNPPNEGKTTGLNNSIVTPQIVLPGNGKISFGSTPIGNTNWLDYYFNGKQIGIYVDVDTSSAGFTSTPIYITSLGGQAHHWRTVGASSIYEATPTSFRIYLQGLDAITPQFANENNWHIQWIGIESA